MTDDDLQFAAWRAGDRGAGAALIERHFDSLERFFTTKAGDHAEDLVQRTFLTCTEAAATYRADGSFRAFLFGIARNVLFEHIRSRVRHGSEPTDFSQSAIRDMSPGVSTLAQYRADQRSLIDALQRLPVDLQILLELYYWEELGIEELAAVVEVPTGTIKSRLHRARTMLAEAMEQAPGGDEDGSVRALLVDWLAGVKSQIPAR
jgi:RNA polymerase sigma factor (sigma-70 family)